MGIKLIISVCSVYLLQLKGKIVLFFIKCYYQDLSITYCSKPDIAKRLPLLKQLFILSVFVLRSICNVLHTSDDTLTWSCSVWCFRCWRSVVWVVRGRSRTPESLTLGLSTSNCRRYIYLTYQYSWLVHTPG